MKISVVTTVLIGVTLAACTSCAPNQSTDQIREDTAKATATLKRDTKAVAEGVKEGLSSDSKKPVDLNNASKDDLESLPGINAQRADRIMAQRPYAGTKQLVTRHVLSESQYAQIQDRVVVNR